MKCQREVQDIRCIFGLEIGGKCRKHVFNQCIINLTELLYNAGERERDEINVTRERIYR